MVSTATTEAPGTDPLSLELTDAERMRLENRMSGLGVPVEKQSLVVEAAVDERHNIVRQFILTTDPLAELVAAKVIDEMIEKLAKEEGN